MTNELKGLRVYVAAPWVHREDAKKAANLITERGGVITEPWWEHKDVGVYPGPADDPADLEELQAQAFRDIDGVQSADVLVALQLAKSEGKAVEQGLALAFGVPIMVVSPNGDRGHIFHYLLNQETQILSSIEEVVEMLVEGLKEIE